MAEKDVINYVKKCTAVLLEKLDQLGVKIDKLGLLLAPERNMFYRVTANWKKLYQANEEL